MKLKYARLAVPLAVVAIVAVGFATSGGVGTLSALGWGDIALLCPLGALGAMLASKTIIPQALISLAVAVVAVLLAGRIFCGWVCPVPLVSKAGNAFRGSRKKHRADDSEVSDAESGYADASDGEAETVKPLTQEEKDLIKGCHRQTGASLRSRLDSRHAILGGALASAALFGFPVFCLICPVGLTFATIFLAMRAFGFGDVSVALLVAPVLLVLEVVVFRRWCHRLCPLSALMSLVGRGNRTFAPAVDRRACLESAKGVTCGRCAKACSERLDPHGSDFGKTMGDCTRCGACVEACPAHAITIAALPRSASSSRATNEKTLEMDEEAKAL